MTVEDFVGPEKGVLPEVKDVTFKMWLRLVSKPFSLSVNLPQDDSDVSKAHVEVIRFTSDSFPLWSNPSKKVWIQHFQCPHTRGNKYPD